MTSHPAATIASSGADRVDDLLRRDGLSCSFEFSPPRTDADWEPLQAAIRRVEAVAPTFISVTYGAGGSTVDRLRRTTGVVEDVLARAQAATVGHLTCVGATLTELQQVVDIYRTCGIQNVLALRGDPPEGPGAPWRPIDGGLRYALDLVELLAQTGDFCVGVAAFPYRHPASPDLEHDARILAMKARAGASFAVTQLFFEADAYAELVDRAARHGCDIPIIPGLMPITRLGQIERFTALNGTPVPADLVSELASAQSPPDVRRIGIEQTTRLAARLLEMGAPGLHFYTLNRSTATMEIHAALGLGRSNAAAGQSAGELA